MNGTVVYQICLFDKLSGSLIIKFYVSEKHIFSISNVRVFFLVKTLEFYKFTSVALTTLSSKQ